MRYSKIMEMYEKFFEKTDSTKRSSLDGGECNTTFSLLFIWVRLFYRKILNKKE